MEDERSIAKKDYVLKKLVAECALEGDVYSSDEELDLPYENNDISDDIDEIVFREQIRGAKKFFQEITEVDDDDDDLSDLVDEVLELNSDLSEDHIVVKSSVKYSDALSYFEIAMEKNSKMRDTLLTFEQALLKKKQEIEDLINVLDSKDNEEVASSEPSGNEVEETVTWGSPEFFSLKDGVVFTNKSSIFLNQFLPPYFKDKKQFFCPPNRDTVEREKQAMVKVSSIEPSKHWSSHSIDNLEKAIKKSLVEEFKGRADFKAIYKWREYSSFVANHSLEEILKAKPPDFKFDWLHIATLLPQEEMRNSNECSKLWDLYLSPKFSKEEWTREEDERIISLAQEYGEQSWDLIASELGTSRSPFQVFSYYESNLRVKVHAGVKWSPEEDEYLKKIVGSCTYGNYVSWKKVMYYFEKRSYSQVYNRWINHAVCKKKGKFSVNEDRAMLTAMAHGLGCRDTAKAMKGMRTQQQIRDRLVGIVKFGKDDLFNIGNWSLDEDNRLLALYDTHGDNSWSTIAKNMVTRDRTQCRHRFTRLKRKMSDPDFDISNLDRAKTKKKYARNLRKKKKNLLKILGKGGQIPQYRRRQFLNEVNTILDDKNSLSSYIDGVNTTLSEKCLLMIRHLAVRGSGCWMTFDPCKGYTGEKQLVTDCCNLLNARFNYDLDFETILQDEHMYPVKGLLPHLLEKAICDVKLDTRLLSCDGASTSTGISSRKLFLMPPNALTCSGFFQSLAFCSANESARFKIVQKYDNDEAVNRAKALFKERLLQLFLWPAILSNTRKAHQYNSYGGKPLKTKKTLKAN